MFAQCPKCLTIFAVTAAHLKAREGMVRCGECSAAFNAAWHLLDALPDAQPTRLGAQPAAERADPAPDRPTATRTHQAATDREPPSESAEARRSVPRPAVPPPDPTGGAATPRPTAPEVATPAGSGAGRPEPAAQPVTPEPRRTEAEQSAADDTTPPDPPMEEVELYLPGGRRIHPDGAAHPPRQRELSGRSQCLELDINLDAAGESVPSGHAEAPADDAAESAASPRISAESPGARSSETVGVEPMHSAAARADRAPEPAPDVENGDARPPSAAASDRTTPSPQEGPAVHPDAPQRQAEDASAAPAGSDAERDEADDVWAPDIVPADRTGAGVALDSEPDEMPIHAPADGPLDAEAEALQRAVDDIRGAKVSETGAQTEALSADDLERRTLVGNDDERAEAEAEALTLSAAADTDTFTLAEEGDEGGDAAVEASTLTQAQDAAEESDAFMLADEGDEPGDAAVEASTLAQAQDADESDAFVLADEGDEGGDTAVEASTLAQAQDAAEESDAFMLAGEGDESGDASVDALTLSAAEDTDAFMLADEGDESGGAKVELALTEATADKLDTPAPVDDGDGSRDAAVEASTLAQAQDAEESDAFMLAGEGDESGDASVDALTLSAAEDTDAFMLVEEGDESGETEALTAADAEDTAADQDARARVAKAAEQREHPASDASAADGDGDDAHLAQDSAEQSAQPTGQDPEIYIPGGRRLERLHRPATPAARESITLDIDQDVLAPPDSGPDESVRPPGPVANDGLAGPTSSPPAPTDAPSPLPGISSHPTEPGPGNGALQAPNRQSTAGSETGAGTDTALADSVHPFPVPDEEIVLESTPLLPQHVKADTRAAPPATTGVQAAGRAAGSRRPAVPPGRAAPAKASLIARVARLGSWIFGCAALIALLVWQGTRFYLNDLAQVTSVRPVLQKVCPVFGCTVPERRAPKEIDLVGTSVATHPDIPGALRVNVNVINRADFTQGYPYVEVTLTDKNGRIVGRENYTPEQYREFQMDGTVEVAALQPNVVQTFTLDLAAPPNDAVGYEVQLLNR